MEFFEFVLAFSIIFVLPLTVLKMALDYKKSQRRLRTAESESGVTAGELKRLLREAVHEANAPLVERVAELEAHVRPSERLEAGRAESEGLDDEAYAVEPQDRTLGRPVAE